MTLQLILFFETFVTSPPVQILYKYAFLSFYFPLILVSCDIHQPQTLDAFKQELFSEAEKLVRITFPEKVLDLDALIKVCLVV